MKKLRRILWGYTIPCLCFFLSMIGGTYISPLDAEVSTKKNPGLIGPPAPTDGLPKYTMTPAPTNSPAPSPTPTLSPTPTISPTPTNTPTPTISPTPTNTPTPTISPTPTNTPTPTISPTPVPQPLVLDFTMPAVSTNLNVRLEPNIESELIGKLPLMTYAFILEESQNGWTKIKTGNVEEGYVSSEYLFTQEEIMSLCDREQLVHATTTSGLNVRSGPGTHYEIITKILKDKTYPVVLAQSFAGWYAIRLNDSSIGYISANYVELSYDLDTGYTMTEYRNMLQTKDFEKKYNLEPGDGERVKANMITSIKETQRDPITMTEDEIYLFATIIYTEAGNQKYEGKLAVANVIINRLLSGRYGKTLKDVIYAPGQFAGSAPELVARAQSRGIPESCYKAVREALAGKNNIGDFFYFRNTMTAYKAKDYATYSKFYVLEDHVFYKKNWN